MSAAALFVLLVGQAVAECRENRVYLRGTGGEVSFEVDIADTPAERARGLMFVEKMSDGEGMLFIYEVPQPVSFWMKNTLIPLDMIFLNRSGTVSRVHAHAIPGDLTPIDGGADVLAVLEINAGLSAALGIGVGAQMRHRAFSAGPPAWPC